mgnify:CR=1 FL=1
MEREDKNKHKALHSRGLMLQIALSVDPRVKNQHSTQATERFQSCPSLMKLNLQKNVNMKSKQKENPQAA